MRHAPHFIFYVLDTTVILKFQVGIWDCETRKFVADLSFSSEVRRVRLTKDMIIIGLDRMIKVFSFTRPPSQIKVLETGKKSGSV